MINDDDRYQLTASHGLSSRSTVLVNGILYEIMGTTFTLSSHGTNLHDDSWKEKAPGTPLEKLRHQQKEKNKSLKAVKGHKKGRWG